MLEGHLALLTTPQPVAIAGMRGTIVQPPRPACLLASQVRSHQTVPVARLSGWSAGEWTALRRADPPGSGVSRKVCAEGWRTADVKLNSASVQARAVSFCGCLDSAIVYKLINVNRFGWAQNQVEVHGHCLSVANLQHFD